MSRRPKLVHFQHHLCIVADPKAQVRHGDYERFGRQQRTPRWYPRCAWRHQASQLTATEIDKVTCTRCIERREAEQEQESERWVPDEKLVQRAWLMCCRYAGAPSPFTPTQLQDIDRALRADAIDDYGRLLFGVLARPPSRDFDERSALIDPAKRLSRLDEDLRFVVRPFLDEYYAICDEMERRTKEALRKIAGLADELAPRPITAIPGSGWREVG